jgi:hypothetical protein
MLHGLALYKAFLYLRQLACLYKREVYFIA